MSPLNKGGRFAGAVDGTSGENKYYVNNFTLEQNAGMLRRLRWLMEQSSN